MWLGIETSSLVSSVALMDEHNLIGELTIQAGLTHSEQLIPHIDMLLRASQVKKNELKGISLVSGLVLSLDCVLAWGLQKQWLTPYKFHCMV